MIRILAYLAISICCIITLTLQDTQSPAFALAGGFLAGFAVPVVDAALTNWNRLRLVYYSVLMVRKRVRISVSYLYRIELDGEFLLVRGKRFDHFQPVGGVYKMLPEGRITLRRRLGASDDNLIPRDNLSTDDLRLYLPGRNLHSFIRWFESEKGREVGAWREFQEELLATGILNPSDFPFVNCEFLRRYYHPLRYSRYVENYELLVADIFELVPTPAQVAALKQLHSDGHADIEWVSEERIRRLGAEPGRPEASRVAEPAMWIL